MAQQAAQAVTGDAFAATPTDPPTSSGESTKGRRSWPQPVIGTFDFDPDGDFDTSVPAWQDTWPFQSTGSLASLMSSMQDFTVSTPTVPTWSYTTPTWQAEFSSALPLATWLSQWPLSEQVASSITSATSLPSTATSAPSTQAVATSTIQSSLSAVSSTTTFTPQSTTSGPSSPASTAALHESHSPTSRHLSLSRGAIVAIAAGSALVLLLLIVFFALTLCCSRRRRRERSAAKSNGDGVYINHTWRSDQASMSDASHSDGAWRESVTPYTLGGTGAGPQDGQPSESAPFDHYSYAYQPTSHQQPSMTYASTPPRQVTAGPLSQRQQASASIPPTRNLTNLAHPAAFGGQGDRESPARASSSLTTSGTGAAWTTRAMHTRGGQGHNVSGSTMASTSGTGGGSSYASSLLDVTKGDVQVKTVSPVEAAGRAHAVPAALFKRCSSRPDMTPTTTMQQPTAPSTQVRPLTVAIQQGDRQTQPQAQTPTSARHDPRARLRYLSSISASSPTTPSARSSDQSFTCADAQALPPYRLTATPPRPDVRLRSERDDGGDDASVYSHRS